jgi:hypothetical protein
VQALAWVEQQRSPDAAQRLQQKGTQQLLRREGGLSGEYSWLKLWFSAFRTSRTSSWTLRSGWPAGMRSSG